MLLCLLLKRLRSWRHVLRRAFGHFFILSRTAAAPLHRILRLAIRLKTNNLDDLSIFLCLAKCSAIALTCRCVSWAFFCLSHGLLWIYSRSSKKLGSDALAVRGRSPRWVLYSSILFCRSISSNRARETLSPLYILLSAIAAKIREVRKREGEKEEDCYQNI